MLRSLWSWGLWALLLALAGPLSAAHRWGLKEGTPDLVSAGQLAFGPDGVVFVGDSKGAAVFAIDTGDVGPAGEVHARSLDDLAAALGQLPGLTAPIAVNDLAVNPLSGQIYLSLASGPERKPAIARIDQSQKLALLNLSKIPFLKATLPNPPEDKVTGEGSRARNRRDETVTDLAYAGGKLLVAGVTAGAAPSTIREIAFPFADQATGTVVEIYHGGSRPNGGQCHGSDDGGDEHRRSAVAAGRVHLHAPGSVPHRGVGQAGEVAGDDCGRVGEPQHAARPDCVPQGKRRLPADEQQ